MTTTEESHSSLERWSVTDPPPLDAHALDALDALVLGAQDPALLEREAKSRIPDARVHPPLHYLLARLEGRRGNLDRARSLWARVIERLNQDEAFEALVAVLERSADVMIPEQLTPLLVRAYRETEGAALPRAALEVWHTRFPHDKRLLWLLGLAEVADGAEEGVGHLADVLPFLARDGDPSDLEEAALPVLEAVTPETAESIVQMLGPLVTHGRYEEVVTYVDLALDGLLGAGQAAPLWKMLSHAVATQKAAKKLRPAAVAALRAMNAGHPGLNQMIEKAGLEAPKTKFAEALKEYRLLSRFPVGGYVEHASWGVGEVLEFDGETLVLRFADKPGHTMTRTLAERALESRAPDDLRVLTTFAPERIAAMRESDAGGLVVAALRALGGQGKPRDLRRVLTVATIPTREWAGWWRKTRAALEEDERLDLTETFQDIYKIADPEAAGGAVLRLEDKGEPTRQIRVIRRFIEQHPDARARTIAAFTRRLDRWLDKRAMSDAEQVLVRIVLQDWHPERRSELVEALIDACERGFDLSQLTAAEDQELLLELGLGAERWQPVALAALSTRVKMIRDRAHQAIGERLDQAGAQALYAELLSQSPARGDAVLEVVEAALEGRSQALAALPTLDLVLGALHVVSEPDREALQNRALRLVQPGGPLLAKLLAESPRTPGEVERVATAFLSFKASDQLLNPIVEAVEEAWGPATGDPLRRRRQREADRIAARMDEDSAVPAALFMSRASYEALKAEAARVDLELKTTIPRAIQKARELGDLRENAEYDAAKLKQRQYNDRLGRLADQLGQAVVIEETRVTGDEVFVGTEVTLEPVDGGSPFSVWVLGHNDSTRAENALSCHSEAGHALWMKRVGDEFDLPGETSRRVRIESIRVKMPDAAAPADTLGGSSDHGEHG